MIDKETGKLSINYDDDVIKGALVTRDGKIVEERVKANAEKGDGPAPAKTAAKKSASKKSSAKKSGAKKSGAKKVAAKKADAAKPDAAPQEAAAPADEKPGPETNATPSDAGEEK